MATDRTLVQAGERAPDFAARRGDGRAARFYGFVGGRPAVVLLSGARDEDGVAELRDRLADAVAPVADLHVVTTGPTVTDRATFHDPDGRVHAAYGVATDAAPVAVVLDPNVRVTATVQCAGDDRADAVVADAVAAATINTDARVVRGLAPVLFVPNALDETTCADLIARWERSGGVATGVETTAADGRVEQHDQQRKRRRDHTVTDADVMRALSSTIGRRVMPEIRKAFAYRASRFEGFKIGCYTAEDRGFFTAHRDNISPSTAHRAFGLTLNLNTDYDGGELRFPEYGPDRYRPAAGEALVFSGSHLHEVLPVTRGRRFVLLSFLFSADAATAS